MSELARRPTERDLSPTALYTAGTWAWAGLPGAELFADKDTRGVFRAVNFALGVARLFRWGAPSLPRSLVQRHVMIDRLLSDEIQARGCRAVLELAAGLSARGARVTTDGTVAYVEVDRAHVIARKRALLARSDAGRAVLGRANLTLVGADLAAAALATLAPPPPGPLTIIAEGLLMYLDAGAQRRLFAEAQALLAARGGALLFDLVPAAEQPRPGLLGRALGWLMRRFTRGGDFVRDARGRDDIAAELGAVGFAGVTMLEPRDAPPAWQLPHLDRRTQQLVFVARAPVPLSGSVATP